MKNLVINITYHVFIHFSYSTQRFVLKRFTKSMATESKKNCKKKVSFCDDVKMESVPFEDDDLDQHVDNVFNDKIYETIGLSRAETLSAQIPNNKGKVLNKIPKHYMKGYCLVFERKTNIYRLNVDTINGIIGINRNEKTPGNIQDWKKFKNKIDSHHLTNMLKYFITSNIEYYITYSKDKLKRYVYVIIGCSINIAEKWAAAHRMDVPIDPKEAVRIGKKFPDFHLAHHTKLEKEEDDKFKDEITGKNFDKLPLKYWENIHIEYIKDTIDPIVYKKKDCHYQEQFKTKTVITHRLYLRILEEILTEERKFKGAEFIICKYLDNSAHPLKKFFALNTQCDKPKFNKRKYLCGCTQYEIPKCCQRWIIWRNEQQTQEFVDEIRNYYGEYFGFWYAFLLHYTKWLQIMIIPGVVWQFIQLYFKNIAIEGSTIIVLIVIIWSTIMIENWYRREWKLRFKWGMMRYQQTEVPRPTFKGHTYVSEENGEIIESHKKICSYPCGYWLKVIFSLSTMLLLLGLVVVVVIYIWFIGNKNRDNRVLSFGLGVLNSVQIFVMNKIYTWLAYKLNEWEGHRLQQEYYNSLVIKRIIFITWNSFYSLLYIAFFDPNPAYNDNTARLYAVQLQLATLFFTAVILQNFAEFGLPVILSCLKHKYYHLQESNELRYDSSNLSSYESCNNDNDLTDDEALQLKEKEEQNENQHDIIKDIETQINLSPAPDVLDNTAEIVVLHGYIMLFVVVLPIMPLLAVINNYFEIRVDFYNLIHSQRPIPEASTGLGVWKTVMYSFSVIGIFTNLALLTFRTSLIGNILKEILGNKYVVRNEDLIIFYLVACIVLLFVVLIIWIAIDDQPSSVRKAIARQEACHKHLLMKPVDDLARQHTIMIKKSKTSRFKPLNSGKQTDSFEQTQQSVNSPFSPFVPDDPKSMNSNRNNDEFKQEEDVAISIPITNLGIENGKISDLRTSNSPYTKIIIGEDMNDKITIDIKDEDDQKASELPPS